METVFDQRTAVVSFAQTPYWSAGEVIVSYRTVPEVFDSSLAVANKVVRSYIHPRRRRRMREAKSGLSVGGKSMSEHRERGQGLQRKGHRRPARRYPTERLGLAVSRLLTPTRVGRFDR